MLRRLIMIREANDYSPQQKYQMLTPLQITMLAIFGAILWFAAANTLRVIGPMGAFQGYSRVMLYIAIIPGTYPFVLLAKKMIKLASDQIAIGYTVATATATLLDGMALAWFPALYGSSAEQVAASGAAILWGVGVGLVLALMVNRRGA
jgi:hypothetical protein